MDRREELLNLEFTIAFNATQLVLTLTGNLLVCVAFYKVKSLRTPANVLLVSLAVADLLFVGVSVMNIVQKSLATKLQLACFLRKYLYHTLNVVVLWNLAAISVDRLLAIKYPLRYKGMVTKRRAVIAVVIVWILAVALAMLPSILQLVRIEEATNDQEEFTDLLFGKRTCRSSALPRHRQHRGRKFNIKWPRLLKSFFSRLFPLILPYIILFVTYAWIFVISWRHYKRVKRQLEALCPERKLQMKFAKTSAIIMGSFLILFTPLLVLAMTRMLHKAKHVGFKALIVANLIASNSAWLNPPIYAWRNRNFRKAFRKLLRPLCVYSYGPTPPLRKNPKTSPEHQEVSGERIRKNNASEKMRQKRWKGEKREMCELSNYKRHTLEIYLK